MIFLNNKTKVINNKIGKRKKIGNKGWWDLWYNSPWTCYNFTFWFISNGLVLD